MEIFILVWINSIIGQEQTTPKVVEKIQAWKYFGHKFNKVWNYRIKRKPKHVENLLRAPKSYQKNNMVIF